MKDVIAKRYGVLPWSVDLSQVEYVEVLRVMTCITAESHYSEFLSQRT